MADCSAGAAYLSISSSLFLSVNDYGNHLQWVYGDWTEDLRRLGEMLGLQVEVIA